MSRRTAAYLCGFILFYGFLSVLFSAWTNGPTYDEHTFMVWGPEYLRLRDPFLHTDHPPLALWWGSLIPFLTSMTEVFYFRLGNTLIYLFAGSYITYQLFKNASITTALIFAILFAFDPNLKSLASLFVTDLTVTGLLGCSAISLWVFLNKEEKKYLGFASAFFGFAVSAKVSAFFWAPFFALALFLHSYKKKTFWSLSWFCLKIFLLSGFVAYLGVWRFYRGWRESYKYSMTHNKGGHIISLLGQYATFGFWYYYLVCFAFKSTPLFLGSFVSSLGSIFTRHRKKMEMLIFLAPAILLFILLSRAQVQVGYRYFLPGIILLVILFSLSLGRWLENWKYRSLAILLILLSAAASDWPTLKNHNYISYFNFATPAPTRNFTGADNDWGQGIPQHLVGSLNGARSTKFIFDFLLEPQNTADFYVGASELVGFWGSTLGVYFRSQEPQRVIASHEIHNFSKNAFFHIMNTTDSKLNLWDDRYLKATSQAIPENPGCQVFSRPLFQQSWLNKQEISEIRHQEEIIPESRDKDVIIVVDSYMTGQILLDGKPATFTSGEHTMYFSLVWWRHHLNKGSHQWRLELLPVAAKLDFRALMMWQECSP